MMRVLQSLSGIFLAVMLLASACSVGVLLGSARASGEGLFATGDAVAVVRVEGAIMSGEQRGLLAPDGAYSETIVKQLRRAGKNNSVKAVVLRVDSPGGGITPSDEIRNQVLRLRSEDGKPVVASMGGIAASGGYYVSAAADTIMANETTITGSIGVIAVVPNMQGLLDKIGVSTEVFTSGPQKDAGSGLVPLTDEERQVLQSVIDEAHNRFVKVVQEGRKIEEASVRRLADGRIYTARQAKDLGLIDTFGDLPDAIQTAAEMGNISGKPRVIEYRSGGLFSSVGASALARWRPQALEWLLDNGASFSINYLYIGRAGISVLGGS